MVTNFDAYCAAMCKSNLQNTGASITVYTANDMVQSDVHTLSVLIQTSNHCSFSGMCVTHDEPNKAYLIDAYTP